MPPVCCFLVAQSNFRMDDEATFELFDIRRVDTDELVVDGALSMYGVAPAGAMWFTESVESHRPSGPEDWPAEGFVRPTPDAPRSPSSTFTDGPQLIVSLPNNAGIWNVDSRGGNCTKPYDYDHRCWVREGEPPDITVGKGGITCDAGWGSILAGEYHGFLRDGWLIDWQEIKDLTGDPDPEGVTVTADGVLVPIASS